MTKIAIILFPETILSGLHGALDIFNWANQLYRFKYPKLNSEKSNYFQIQLLSPVLNSLNSKPNKSVHKFNFNVPNYKILPLPVSLDVDMILIPGVSYFQFNELNRFFSKFKSDKNLISILNTHLQKKKPIMSCCTSTILLAEIQMKINLKPNTQLTSKWWFKEDAQKHYPKIQFNSKLPIIKNHQIWSCATAFTSFEMIIYWIETLWGASLTNRLKQYLSFETHSYFLTQTTSLTPWSETPQEISKMEIWIQQNIFKNIQVTDLAKHFGYSPRTLNRKIKLHLGQSPKDWMQKIKMESAKLDLEKNNNSIEDIAFKYGYQDSSSFRKAFFKIVGMTPKAYQLSRSQLLKPNSRLNTL